jgi:GT2 family glycosyltransferase
VHVCTVISRTHIAHARALAGSLRAHEPDAGMSVLIVDPIDGFVDPAREPFDVLTPQELGIADFDAMSVRYEVGELCNALKPWALRHTLTHSEIAIHLDGDVRVYAPLDGLAALLEDHPVVLTPHLLRPLPDDGRVPSELSILMAGTFNAGVIAMRSGPQTSEILDWWSAHLRTESRLDAARGLVYDQRWIDLLPSLFPSVGICRDPGINVGYWRVPSSEFQQAGDGVLVDGQPLRCFHFTGFDPKHPERLSRYDSRDLLNRQPALAELCLDCARQLEECGDAQASSWSYGLGATAGGVPLTKHLRECWDRGAREGALSLTPFTSEGEQAFLRWLAEPEDGEHASLNRFLVSLHESDPELSARFPDPYGSDLRAFEAWADTQAAHDPNGVLALLRARRQASRQAGVRELHSGQSLGAERGEVVVCIPVYGAPELFAECLTSVLAHTPEDVRILVADDASPDPAIRAFVESLGDLLRHEVSYLRQPSNLGFPGNVNTAFAAAAPADVVVLNSDCVVAAGWLEGLRRAAYSDGLVATASALTNHGTILSVPRRNHPQPGIPQDQDLTHAAGAVMAQALRLYPHLPTAVGHCMYVRRHALDLVGDFDLAFSPGYGEEVDFSQRCVLHGLIHVAADDVFVLHHAGGSFGEDGKANPVQKQHDRVISARYPYYDRAQTAASHTRFGRLPRAIAAAGRAIKGLSVTIDGRCLGPLVTGTQVHALQLIAALEATEQLGVRVIVPPDLGARAAEQLAARPRIQLIAHTDVHPGMEKADVAHRPYQVNNTDDLLILRCAGERQVITHQDLIAYRNPGYFPGYPQWERYQRLTRQALALSDMAVFFSHHAAADALGEDLVDPARVRVVYIGVDHQELPATGAPQPPRGAEKLSGKRFLLCLGTDFKHKNRVFALRLLQALREQRGWDGELVLAGPRVNGGSSAGEEAAYLATRPQLREAVTVLPAVGESEKRWLLDSCAAVLYPTTYEGFGLMPFEAADHGRPCLFASQTALAEILPSELATLVPWDANLSAERVSRLLSKPEAVDEHVLAIRRAGARFTWQSTGEAMVDVYRAAAASPAREASRLADDLLEVEAERHEAERKYNELWQSLTPEARTLVAPGGPLSPSEHRSLAAVVRRPLARRLLLGPTMLAYRAKNAKRRAPEPPATAPAEFALHFDGPNVEHMREQLASAEPPAPHGQPPTD